MIFKVTQTVFHQGKYSKNKFLGSAESSSPLGFLFRTQILPIRLNFLFSDISKLFIKHFAKSSNAYGRVFSCCVQTGLIWYNYQICKSFGRHACPTLSQLSDVIIGWTEQGFGSTSVLAGKWLHNLLCLSHTYSICSIVSHGPNTFEADLRSSFEWYSSFLCKSLSPLVSHNLFWALQFGITNDTLTLNK